MSAEDSQESRITATMRPLESEASLEISIDKTDGAGGLVAFFRFCSDLLETCGAITLTASSSQPCDRPTRSASHPTNGRVPP